MRKRMLGQLLAVLLLAWPLGAAPAASPVGSWKPNAAALAAMIKRVMELGILQMRSEISGLRGTDPAKAATRELAVALAEQRLSQIARAIMSGDPDLEITIGGMMVDRLSDATITFAADGAVTVEEAPGTGEPQRATGRWRLIDDGIEVALDGRAGRQPMLLRGPLEDAAMTLRYVPTSEERERTAADPNKRALQEVSFVLVRR